VIAESDGDSAKMTTANLGVGGRREVIMADVIHAGCGGEVEASGGEQNPLRQCRCKKCQKQGQGIPDPGKQHSVGGPLVVKLVPYDEIKR
jgi:hypothetical protein